MKPCGPGFQIETFEHARRDDRDPRADEHRERHGEDVEHDELDLARLDLLAEVLRRAPDHQAGDEDREQREHEHPVQPDTDAARADLAELHVDERHHPAERRVAVVHRVHRAVRRPGGRRGPERRRRRAVADLLALEVPARLASTWSTGRPSARRASGCRSARTSSSSPTTIAQIVTMTASSTQPWRWSPTIFPYV